MQPERSSWLDQIPAPAAVVRGDSRIVECNAEAAVLLGTAGYPGEPAVIVPPLRRVVQSALAGGPGVVLLVRRVRGRRRAFELRCRRLDGNQLFVLFADCTRQLEQRAVSRADDRRLRALLANAPEPAVVEQAGRVAYANAAAASLFTGSAQGALIGRAMSSLLPHAAAARSAGSAETGQPDETKVAGAAGSRSVRVLPLPVRYREAPATLLLLLDTTTLKQTEERLRASEAQLRQAQRLQAVGKLAAGVAHDFNNMLTAIRGHTALLQRALPEGSDLHVDAEEITRAAVRAADLTRQLLTFSRRQPESPGLIDVNSIVRGLEKLLLRLLCDDTRLELALQPSLPHVIGDVGQLEQTLMNLVVNAREAVREGGTIAIRTRVRHTTVPTPAHGVAMPPGEYVQLEVSDDGYGMSAATLGRIFDPFFTTKVEGTGLGLATVLSIVTQLSGYIVVESREGAGATFTISLPAAQA